MVDEEEEDMRWRHVLCEFSTTAATARVYGIADLGLDADAYAEIGEWGGWEVRNRGVSAKQIDCCFLIGR